GGRERTKRDTTARVDGRIAWCYALLGTMRPWESARAPPPSPEIHMQRVLRLARVLPALSLVFAPRLLAQTKPTIEQFMSPASPIEITSARNADRVAWMAYERGMRNVYTAAAPDFKPVRLTRFLEDDGIDLTDVELSDDGTIAVFVRGSAPNRVGWIANPAHDPDGGERAIWAVRTSGGPAWRVAVGGAPALSPDGRYVLYVKDNQIYRARVSAGPA